MMKKIFLLIFLWISVFFNAQSSTFQITYNGITPQAKVAIDKAAEIWSNILVSDVPIKINLNWVNASSLGFLGVCVSNGAKDFPNAPLTDVWYPSCLADAYAGTDLNPNQTDMDIYLDSSRNWYFGTDGNGPGNQFDLVNVALHEICHGLGFYSIANIDFQGIGSFSLEIDPNTSLLASFPIPNLAGKPLIFDLFIENQQGDLLANTNMFLNPSLGLANQFTSNNLFFNGLNATSANNNIPPKLYAPTTFSFGSSVLHLDETDFAPHTDDAVMTPYSSPGEANHNPGPVTVGILQDLGWSIHPTFIINESEKEVLNFYPNPVKDAVCFSFKSNKKQFVELSIYDLQGRKVKTLLKEFIFNGFNTFNWNVDVNSGCYLVVLKSDDVFLSRKMIVK